tara:strand:+ start:170 stop:349 length:180 start_codon:yes stop_codon:yes gene_type:complete
MKKRSLIIGIGSILIASLCFIGCESSSDSSTDTDTSSTTSTRVTTGLELPEKIDVLSTE